MPEQRWVNIFTHGDSGARFISDDDHPNFDSASNTKWSNFGRRIETVRIISKEQSEEYERGKKIAEAASALLFNERGEGARPGDNPLLDELERCLKGTPHA